MEIWYPAVTAYIEEHRDDIVRDLKALARIPSISKAGKDGLPFGKEVDEALSAAAALFTDNGIPMEVKHDHGYALAVCEGEGDGIGLFGHADVVPVNDDWVKTKPFEPLEENGLLYGRGVNDNKAGVIACLYALRALKAADVELKSRLTVYVGGSEETGMKDLEAFVEHERMPEVSITPDSDYPVSVGEKGILHVECRSREALKAITEFEGGQAYNVVLDRVNVEVSGETVVFEGLAAHAAHPERGVNAAYKAAEALCERADLCDGDRRILAGLRDTLCGCHGAEVDIFSEGAFGKLSCANGIVRLEDGHLVFTLDIRYGNEFDHEAGIPRLVAAMDARGYDAVIKSNSPGFLLDEKGAHMNCILQSYRDAADRPDAAPYKTYGGTYARRLKNAFAVDHCLPWDRSVLDLPAGHGGAHQSDEVLCIEALLGGIKALALALGRLDDCLIGG